jgi:NhaA family Na+:H+ antiporter
VHLGGDVLVDALTSVVGLGIMLGLVLGKPVGIVLFALAAVRAGLGRLPDRTGWRMMLGLGTVAGIGFTVSLFIAGLSFPGDEAMTAEAQIGILGGSLAAAVLGIVLLLSAPDPPVEDQE